MKKQMAATILLSSILFASCDVPQSPVVPEGFHNLDSIRFFYGRSFKDSISIELIHRTERSINYEMETIITHYPEEEGEKISYAKDIKEIGKEDFKRFEELFFRRSVTEKSLTEGLPGADGSSWTLSARKNGLIIVHDRWSPADRGDSEFVEIGKAFLDLAGVEIPPDELY